MVGVLPFKLLNKFVAKHLFEVGGVVVVHDGEVLLVQVQLRQVEGAVGEPQPEPVVGVDFEGTDALEKDNITNVKLDLAYFGPVE